MAALPSGHIRAIDEGDGIQDSGILPCASMLLLALLGASRFGGVKNVSMGMNKPLRIVWGIVRRCRLIANFNNLSINAT
jgi:hypothetical protein